MPAGISFAEYLQGLSVEQGLLAETEFRRHHLESLRQWPSDDRIRLFRYEEILGNEHDVFGEIFSFYELPWYERRAGMWLAVRPSALLMRRMGSFPSFPWHFPAIAVGLRRAFWGRFPFYALYYQVQVDVIEVIACFHARRSPSRWNKRDA